LISQIYVPQDNTKIFILATGRSDGYPMFLSDLRHVLIRGKRGAVVGLVSMEQLMVGVGHIPDVTRRTRVRVSAVELANHLKTTAALITCNIAGYIEKIYMNNFWGTERI
jgi:alanine racemase